MLSAEHRAIIKSTVPLLEAGGEALATHFYAVLLAEQPALRSFFNPAHQHDGRQPRALAQGLLRYARHIDELERLGDLVATIVAKHVALQIQPEHYPAVGACLLQSLRAVLGPEIATPTVLAAWRAAYEQLADILVGAEAAAYADLALQPGGWRGGRLFWITRKQRESDEIVSLYLAPVDGEAVLVARPGQYIGVRLDVAGQDVRRNYSLSALSDGLSYRISVKREPGGLVSTHLHDGLAVGGTLEVFPPAGNFTLAPGARALVLLSAGVGLTPLMAMLTAALDTGRPVRFIHAARHAGVHAFRDHVDALAARHPQLQRFYCYETPAACRAESPAPDAIGLVGQEQLRAWLPPERDVEVYFLGPLGFMRAMKKHLAALGVPAAQAHCEFFGPAMALD